MLRKSLDADRDDLPIEAAFRRAPRTRYYRRRRRLGRAILIAEPWRVARIIRGAETMTFDELAAEIARTARQARPRTSTARSPWRNSLLR